VQRAACGGLAALVEEAQAALAPRLEPIVQHLVFALGMYQRKSQRSLFEALGTLANCMGSVMAEPSIAALLLPPLLAKWQVRVLHSPRGPGAV
jgi:transportin-1